MHRALPYILFAIAVATPAQSQTAGRAPKPYAPVAIAPAAASDDTSLADFRALLTKVARRRIYAELAPLVRSPGFFWDRDFARGFDPRKPAVDNLAAALRLEHDRGSGWKRLAALAAEAAVEPLPSRPGVVCAPAEPRYDSVAFARLLDATHTVRDDWSYPRAEEMPVHPQAQPGAAVIATLGQHFIRVLRRPDGGPSAESAEWTRVATPDGTSGYVASDGLRSLAGEQLCYGKDIVLGWRIAGYIAAGP